MQDSKDASRAHTSHLSDTSSLNGQLSSTSPEPSMNSYEGYSGTSAERRYTQQMHSTSPWQGLQQQEQPMPPTGSQRATRRSSNASSHQTHSSAPSTNSSHGNTRELGDVYESDWSRYSNQQQAPFSGVKGGQSENQSKEPRRQSHLAVNVPSAVASPAGRNVVGMAM